MSYVVLRTLTKVRDYDSLEVVIAIADLLSKEKALCAVIEYGNQLSSPIGVKIMLSIPFEGTAENCLEVVKDIEKELEKNYNVSGCSILYLP